MIIEPIPVALGVQKGFEHVLIKSLPRLLGRTQESILGDLPLAWFRDVILEACFRCYQEGQIDLE